MEQGDMKLNAVEIFPSPESFPTFNCSIPDLPEPRMKHSISRLSGGRLVVCGGYVTPSTPSTPSPSTTSTPISTHGSDSCISWAANKLNITSWTNLFKMRLLHHKTSPLAYFLKLFFYASACVLVPIPSFAEGFSFSYLRME